MVRPRLSPLVLLLSLPALGQHALPGQQDDYAPRVEPASDEARAAVQGFEIADGFRAVLFAAEPLLANPVCFAIDGTGRFYVAETFRLHAGVTDMREHMDWLDDELAARTVEDRVAMMRRHEGAAFDAKYAAEHERVRALWDSDGDGVADRSTVFADGFSHPAMGIAAGLLPLGDDVYYTCIPDLWRLTDADHDGVAERRESLHTGWGVHVALLGHDMHGLMRGPDGRLYWSIGDRGFHVEHEGRVLAHPRSGAVLRSEPDGSGLEVFATGLRNPQELAFDDLGNLFTGDNNSDGGDRARWVYLVEGGEIGWRHAYQYVTQPNLRGPWNAEGMWKPPHAEQPAFVLPPIANFTDGPSGLTCYPGTGWGPEWRGTFFLCDFRGAATHSGVHAFENRALGAGFELVNARRFLWNCLPTDVDFGPDGDLYTSDWVTGWGMTGKGRIFRVGPTDVPPALEAERRATRELLEQGMDGRPIPELVALLAHGHRGVRLAAQWQLAERAAAAGEGWSEVARPLEARLADAAAPRLARVHALWGLAHLARLRPELGERLAPALLALHRDADAELRAQLFRTVGDLRWPALRPLALRALANGDARLAGFAAEALGKLGERGAFDALAARVARNDDRDPWLRHQLAWAWVGLGDRERLAGLSADPRPAVRRAAVVALRRLEDAGVARFLDDADPSIVAEAARAIYDGPIPDGLPALAGALERLDAQSDAYLVRRALHACRALGTAQDAQRIVAALPRLSDERAREALGILREWNAPSPRDPICGEWRPLAPRSVPALALAAHELGGGLRGWSDATLADWAAALAASDAVAGDDPAVTALGARLDEALGAEARAAILQALVARGAPTADARVLAAARGAEEDTVRAAALELLGRSAPATAVELLDDLCAAPQLAARQRAVRALAALDHPSATAALARRMRACAADAPGAGLALDLLAAADRSGDPELAAAAEDLRAAQRAADPVLGAWLWALEGGDPRAGRRVFLEKSETSCLRCHALGGEGGSEVGPDLSQVGARLDRRGILQAVVDPNASVAAEFENWVFALDDGQLVVGRVKGETAEELTVETPQKETLVLSPDEIVARRRDLSSMPQDISTHLSPRELRDLVAFLAERR